MKDYVAENDRILNEWQKSNEEHGETNFAKDGIMYRGIIEENDCGTERYSDKEKENKIWNEAPLRILFLTKDQNAGEEEAWDVRGETGSISYAFFRNLMYQLYGYSENIEDSGNLLLNFLKTECYSNLNKQNDDSWIYYDEKRNKIAINNWHLSARKNSENWYVQLIDAYYHFLKEHPDFSKFLRI